MKQVQAKKRRPAAIVPIQNAFARLQKPLSVLGNRHCLGLVITDDTAQLGLVRYQFGSPQPIDVRTMSFERSLAEGWPVRISKAVAWTHDYLHRQKLTRTPINVALLGHDISFRRLILPFMPPSELAEAVRWEGNKLFPFDLAECAVHYEIARRFSRDNADFVAINIIAAGRHIIDALYGQCRATGLVPGQVNFLPCLFTRLLSMEPPVDRQACQVVLFLDENHSLATFIVNGYLEFYQEFGAQPVAGLVGTDAIDNILPLADELTSFVDLYHAQEREHTVQSVILCGKFAGDQRTAAYLTEATGLPCRLAAGMGEPTAADAKIAIPGESAAALLTALAPSHVHPLAPSAYHQQQEKKRFQRRLAVAAVVTLTGLSGWQFATYNAVSDLSHRLESTRSERTEVENSPAYRTFMILNQSAGLKQPPTGTPSASPHSRYQALLKEISLVTPEDLTLSVMDIRLEEGRQVAQLDGCIRVSDFSPEIVLARYVEALTNSPFFDGVTVISHQKQRDGAGFTLNFQLLMDVRV
jgi:Tfp pilus assembly PilM family ATPase